MSTTDLGDGIGDQVHLGADEVGIGEVDRPLEPAGRVPVSWSGPARRVGRDAIEPDPVLVPLRHHRVERGKVGVAWK